MEEYGFRNCYLRVDWLFMDFNPLWNPNLYSFSTSSVPNTGNTYYFNFCELIDAPCGRTGEKAFGYVVNNADASDCTVLTNDNLYPAESEVTDTDGYGNVYQEELLGNMIFDGGDQCGDDDTYSLAFELFCDLSKTEQPTAADIYYDETSLPCLRYISFSHASACSWGHVNTWYALVQGLWFLYAPLMIIYGGAMLTYGAKYLEITQVSSAFIVSFSWIIIAFSGKDWMDLVSIQLPSYYEESGFLKFLVAVVISLAVGAIVAALCWYFPTVGYVYFGCQAVGLSFSVFVYAIFFTYANSTFLLNVITFIFYVIGGLIAFFTKTESSLWLTSLFGGFIIISGVGEVFGGFPRFFYIWQEINRYILYFQWSYVIYLALVIGATVAGYFVQQMLHGNKGDDYLKQ